MSERHQNEYLPDLVAPPGDTLQEVLEQRGMTYAELAERTGSSQKIICDILQGQVAITPEMALRLERVLEVSAAFWNSLERNYQEYLKSSGGLHGLKQRLNWTSVAS